MNPEENPPTWRTPVHGGSGPQGDSAPPEEGEVLFGRYRYLRELGRGGMGVVLLAHDKELGVEIALKMIPDLLVRDSESLGELKNEVLRGMALTHPGIVHTYGFARDATMAAIIMEYVDGGNFGDLKHSLPGGCFDVAELEPWVEQLGPVLDHAHFEARIAHRDLKPRNLMYTRSGRIKVADFGISSTIADTVTRVSMKNASSGTPAYMSPQQVMGDKPSHLDDIYALGATLYELLTGKPPFHKGQILAQVLDSTPPPMEERRKEFGISGKAPIPRQWETTVAACLAKDPAHRPPSAGEVVRMLKESPSATSKRRTSSPYRAAWAATGVGILAIAASVVYFSADRIQKPGEAPPAVISPPPETTPPGIVSPETLPPGTVEQPYRFSFSAREGTPPYTWTLGDLKLHQGLVLDAEGILSGVPMEAGTREFHVTVSGADGLSSLGNFRLTILAKPTPPPGPLVQEIPEMAPSAAGIEVKPEEPPPSAPKPAMISASKEEPFVNSLGMKFVPAGLPEILFSIWHTRVADYRTFATAVENDSMRNFYSMQIGGTVKNSLPFNLPPKGAGKNWENPGFHQTDQHPVCGTSWNDAVGFCDWLTRKETKEGKLPEGFIYRLPTDAEWKSALALQPNPVKFQRFPWGGVWPPPAGCNLSGEEMRDGGTTPTDWPILTGHRDIFRRTSPVDAHTPNRYGIHDMAGNLWQFCQDGPSSENNRWIRGGSWADSQKNRFDIDSPDTKRLPDVRVVDAGFRCVIARKP
jgi:serine/threonine protein kinase